MTGAAIEAAPAAAATIDERQSCVAVCGNVCYWTEDINEAVSTGYNYYRQGKQIGSNKYPHNLDGRDGFTWYTNPPYYEFPIMSNYRPYTGGSPGPDRVIFDSNGRYARILTHTGASGNSFVECRQ